MSNTLLSAHMRVALCIMIVTFISCSNPQQTQKEVSKQNNEDNIKKEFLEAAKSHLAYLKSRDTESKSKQCQSDSGWAFSNYYFEHSDDFTFDIQKTTSIISPYVDYAIYPYKFMKKSGASEALCAMAQPEEIKSDTRKIYFAFQEGKWVTKD